MELYVGDETLSHIDQLSIRRDIRLHRFLQDAHTLPMVRAGHSLGISRKVIRETKKVEHGRNIRPCILLDPAYDIIFGLLIVEQTPTIFIICPWYLTGQNTTGVHDRTASKISVQYFFYKAQLTLSFRDHIHAYHKGSPPSTFFFQSSPNVYSWSHSCRSASLCRRNTLL